MIDIVTVVYSQDILLLKLQARSIRLFFREADIGKIFIVVNEMAPEATYSAIATEVLSEYGRLLRHVEIIPMTHLMRPHVSASGWRTQQTLKLLISRRVETDRYLLLDAKNHFVRPVAERYYFDEKTQKIRSFKQLRHGSLGDYLANSLSYFGVSQENLEYIMPATTPYMVSTAIVRNMIDYIEKKEGMRFDDFFHAPHRNVTEFFLYFAYLKTLEGGPEKYYQFGRRTAVTLFTRWPETIEQLQGALSKLENGETFVFGLHKNRVAKLEPDFREFIVAFWHKIGLFDTLGDADEYMSKSIQAATGGSAELVDG